MRKRLFCQENAVLKHHFSLGIVDGVEREGAWKSSLTRKARRGAWSDFQARSRFARSAIPKGKWGLLVVYLLFGDLMTLFSRNRKSVSCFFFLPQTSLSQKVNTRTHRQLHDDIWSLALFTTSLSPAKFRRITTYEKSETFSQITFGQLCKCPWSTSKAAVNPECNIFRNQIQYILFSF